MALLVCDDNVEQRINVISEPLVEWRGDQHLVQRASLPRRHGVHESLLAGDKVRQNTANIFDLRLQTGYGFYFGPVRRLQYPLEQPSAPVHFVRTVAGRCAL